VKYHEEFEKNIKGSKIQVADDPESRRLKRLGSLVSEVEYRKTESDGRRLSLTNTCMSGLFVILLLLRFSCLI